MNRSRVFRFLRIGWTIVFQLAFVLLIALWMRSYWRVDSVHCPLRSPSMLISTSFRGRLSVRAGKVIPYQTGEYPSGWGMHSYSVGNTVPDRGTHPQPIWRCNIDNYGSYVLFSHWLPVLVLAAFAGALRIRTPYRFSLRTLLIATTLVAVGLGLIILSLR
jgi:hypothetical protein